MIAHRTKATAPSNMDEPRELSESIREWASAVAAHIVPVPLNTGEETATPSAILSTVEFLALLQAVSPAVVYLSEWPLNIAEEVATALDEAQIHPDETAAAEVRKAADKLKEHEGALVRVFAETLIGGVHHVTYVESGWISSFEETVEGIASQHAEEQTDQLRKERLESDSRIRILAEKLVAHPAFHHGRISFAKRRFLASELFSDEDDSVLDATVELAELISWLASARES